MNTWAVPGVQCVCINDDWGYWSIGPCCIPTRVPMLNEVLTIKSVSAADDGVFLKFEEIDEFQVDHKDGCTLGGNIGWGVVHFRPLEKRKTDISIFTKLLTPAGRIPVDA
ncbi:hypothetical protein G6L45_16175 [Agrobacterium rhizogenes]|nr:hypothetical protein [Rhizobium rhizogenes]NTH97021.1 hypothetical protein [Rhizobium rhizogenes]NTJ15207.1 hypothetical protein [Rhizobium rhizogenes]